MRRAYRQLFRSSSAAQSSRCGSRRRRRWVLISRARGNSGHRPPNLITRGVDGPRQRAQRGPPRATLVNYWQQNFLLFGHAHSLELAIERWDGIPLGNHQEIVVPTFKARVRLARTACRLEATSLRKPLRPSNRQLTNQVDRAHGSGELGCWLSRGCAGSRLSVRCSSVASKLCATGDHRLKSALPRFDAS